MCSDCWNQRLNMAATGSTSTMTIDQAEPGGAFIQALAATTKMAEAVPLMANDAGESARAARAVPAVEVEPEEDGLDEEGETLPREGQTDDRPASA